jgi:hypothetical protein
MESLGNALRSKDAKLTQTLLLEQLHRGSSLDLQTLFVLLAYVRDIGGGLGERQLTYTMLDVWYERFPVMAVYALEALILCGYGSWRDVPGLCNYLKTSSVRGRQDDPFIETAIEFMLRHLDDGLACKWVPRETSNKNAWLFDQFVSQWCGVESSSSSSENKRRFRKMISDKTKRAGAGDATAADSCWGLAPRASTRHLDAWLKRLDEPNIDAEWRHFASRKYYPLGDDDDEVTQIMCVVTSSNNNNLVETLLLIEKMSCDSVKVVLTTDPPTHVYIQKADGFSHNVQLFLNRPVTAPTLGVEDTMQYLQTMARAPAGCGHLPVLQKAFAGCSLSGGPSLPYFMLVVGAQAPSLYAVAAHSRYDPMRNLFHLLTT